MLTILPWNQLVRHLWNAALQEAGFPGGRAASSGGVMWLVRGHLPLTAEWWRWAGASGHLWAYVFPTSLWFETDFLKPEQGMSE